MTAKNTPIKDFFKANSYNILVSVLSAASVVIISYFSIRQDMAIFNQRLTANEELDKVQHQLFVTKGELADVKERLDRIENKLDQLLYK